MSLNDRFGWRPAKASDVLRYEREVLKLSLRGLSGSSHFHSTLRLRDYCNEFLGASFHDQSYAIRKVNGEPLPSFEACVRYVPAAEGLRERFGGHGS